MNIYVRAEVLSFSQHPPIHRTKIFFQGIYSYLFRPPQNEWKSNETFKTSYWSIIMKDYWNKRMLDVHGDTALNMHPLCLKDETAERRCTGYEKAEQLHQPTGDMWAWRPCLKECGGRTVKEFRRWGIPKHESRPETVGFSSCTCLTPAQMTRSSL